MTLPRLAIWDDILVGATLVYQSGQVHIRVTEVDQATGKFKGTSDLHGGGWEGERKYVDRGEYLLVGLALEATPERF